MIEQIVEWDGKYFEYTIPNNDLLGLLYTLIEPMVTRIVQSGSKSALPVRRAIACRPKLMPREIEV